MSHGGAEVRNSRETDDGEPLRRTPHRSGVVSIFPPSKLRRKSYIPLLTLCCSAVACCFVIFNAIMADRQKTRFKWIMIDMVLIFIGLTINRESDCLSTLVSATRPGD